MHEENLECGRQLAVDENARAVWCPVCNDMTLVVRDDSAARAELITH